MSAGSRLTHPKFPIRCFFFAMALIVAGPIAQSKADPFEGPSFRGGMWHFVRTIDLVLPKKTLQRLVRRESTQCVDPTHAMMATFASPSIGNCVSAKPEKSDNSYRFSNRCDFMGPVSTLITVQSEEAYTELNESTSGLPKSELVVARRIGDCQEAPQNATASPGFLQSVVQSQDLPRPAKSFAVILPPPH
jgi:hypothetical protein